MTGNPAAAARRVRLRHVSDDTPGITRRRRGRGFEYRTASGRPVPARSRQRIESLAIPPAWKRVWICPNDSGHLQATGYDSRGRKQYRYHPRWAEARNASKFDELAAFGAALPALRARLRRDMARSGMPREKAVACIVSILDQTFVRVGNDEYARDNDSYGLTTIHNGHAKVRGQTVRLSFRTKSGVHCDATVESPRVARIVRRCRELPGQELFCYIDDDGEARDVGSGHVNQYLAAVTGGDFTSKHFRTWGASVIAAESLRGQGFPEAPPSQRETRRCEIIAIDAAAEALCNTRAVCRKYYVHPMLIEAWLDVRLRQAFARAARASAPRGLQTAERALLLLLKG